MSEYTEHIRHEAMLQMVRDEANAREEQYKKDHFEHFLFHDEVRNYHLFNASMDELERIREEFLEDKKNKDMLQRFELALSDKYLGTIHVVELGSTIKPGQNGEIDGLKHEFSVLKKWMQDTGIIKDELPIESSGRFFDISVPSVPEVARERVVIGRTRPLISQIIEVSDTDGGMKEPVQVDIAKRMVFSVPTGLYMAFAKTDPKLEKESTMQSLEELLQQRHKSIYSIRTTYYLRTAVLSEDSE